MLSPAVALASGEEFPGVKLVLSSMLVIVDLFLLLVLVSLRLVLFLLIMSEVRLLRLLLLLLIVTRFIMGVGDTGAAHFGFLRSVLVELILLVDITCSR